MKKKSLTTKRIVIIVAVAFIIFASLFVRYGVNEQPEQESAVHGSGVTLGQLDGNIYTLSGIGMELRLPDNFEVISGKALDVQMKGGASAFYRFAARNDARQEVLTLSVPVTDKSAATYLNEARDTLKNQRAVLGKVEEIEISGFLFSRLRNEADSQDGEKLVELSLVYEQEGHLFCINSLFLKSDESEVMESLKEIIAKTS